MTCLSQSLQCRGELFTLNEDLLLLFITLILQMLQATARATFYHINSLSDISSIAKKKKKKKIKQVLGFPATKGVKWIFHQLHS